VGRVFEAAFPPDGLRVRAHGNVRVAVAFLHGLAAGELTEEELQFEDPDYEVLITIRADKSQVGPGDASDRKGG
jgi:hypothetical protein